MNKDGLLTEIKHKIQVLAQKINAPSIYFPLYVNTGDHYYIDISENGQLSLVYCERGQEFKRKNAKNTDELLYFVFDSVTHSMSSQFEVHNRIENTDHRRLIFAHQEYLLHLLNENWSKIVQKEHKNILNTFPFDDFAGVRADFCRNLRKNNLPEEEIIKTAYEVYPKNTSIPINSGTGDISFRTNILLSPTISLSQSKLLYPFTEIEDMNMGFYWLHFKDIENEDLIWTVSACFKGEMLWTANLSFRKKHEKPLSWGDFSENNEIQEKKKYQKWIETHLGTKIDYPWGNIEAYYSPKSLSSGIWISYKSSYKYSSE